MHNTAGQLLKNNANLAVVGLGYVGLPVAVAFAKKGVRVIGFDINPKKIGLLRDGIDVTGEVTSLELKEVSSRIEFTDDPSALKNASFIIVAVPTPIDEHKNPDLNPLIQASTLVGRNFSQGATIVYESTVYPGVTEEICVPVVEKESGFSLAKGDFYVGYSPERINPGDKEHSLENVIKVVSGQNADVCGEIAKVYGMVVTAGVYRAESIKVAEAAKVIENTQRDLNIALMNELAIIFQKMGISTEAVLKAAATKWNFLRFTPGLVGGHCIGVDPYYLTSKAEHLGYHPQVVLAGRRINDAMGAYVAGQTIKQMVKAKKIIEGANILILGLTFKENVPDFRNSRVTDIIRELETYGTHICAYDPFVDGRDLKSFGVEIIGLKNAKNIDAIILSTPHEEFRQLSLSKLKELCRLDNGKPVLVDVKWVWKEEEATKAGFHYWRL